MKYKINIHAHSIFSDGCNTPYVMALKAKELGFTALVLTDHYYPRLNCDESMNPEKIRLRRMASQEAKVLLPVILGLEICYAGQEILLFGGEALEYVVSKDGSLREEDMLLMRNTMQCAMVLCHPGQDTEKATAVCDGYERINSGNDFFKNHPTRFRTDRELLLLANKQQWCNSDAHMAKDLGRCWNEVDTKITTETDLIKYIKSGKKHELINAESMR